MEPKRSEKWWDAQQRLLLYLQALKMPADRSLEMVLKALRQAMDDSRRTNNPNSTALAIRALRKVLADEGLDCLRQVFCSPGNFHHPGSAKALPLPADQCPGVPGYGEMVFSTQEDLPVMPPLNRGAMRAEPIERSLLHSLVYKLWHKSEQRHRR
ncbi:MAG: hypothetical protein WB792_11120 [Desulfobacterales bacterium]